MCISWTINGLISLMHGVTVKIIEDDTYTVKLQSEVLDVVVFKQLEDIKTVVDLTNII